MKLLISLLFFGINTILCGLCVAVDEEFYSGSDIIVEPDIPAIIRNDEFYKNMEIQENIRDRPSFIDRTSDTVPYTNLNEQHRLNNDRWSNTKNLKKPKKFRQKKNHIKTDITTINSTKSPSPKINHTRKVKVRRKKMKNRDDKIDVTTKKSINSLITMATIKKIENSTEIQQPQKIHSNNIIEMNEKIHERNIFNSTKKRKNQFFKNENQDKFKTKQKIFKKRKSHRNHRNNNDNINVGSSDVGSNNDDDGYGDGVGIGHVEKRKNRVVSHHELSDSGIVSLSNNTYRSQEGFVKDKNSLNYENRFSQVHQKRKHQQRLQQQQHKDKNLNNFESFKVKTNNYGNSYSNYYPDRNGNEFKHDFDDDDDDGVGGDDDGDDYGHDENRLNNERNFQKMKKINVFKTNKRQQLIAQEDNRKLLQAKRELKRKRKYERIERKKRKKINNKNITATLNSPENIGYQQKQIDIIKNNNKNNVTENFVAQPSIDYFIEKPSNYFDINDTPTFGIIGVSVKSPTKNYLSSENDISLSSSSSSSLSSSSSSLSSSSEILLEKMSIPIAVTIGKHTITNNDDDDNEKIEADISSITVKQDNTKMKNLKKISNNSDDDKQQNTMVVTIADRKAQNNDNNFNDDDDDDGVSVDGNNVKNKGDNNGNDNDKEETKKDKNILIEHENIGDLSCLKDDFQPAPEVLHADIKYLRNEEFGTDNAFLEIEYICHHGYKLEWNQNEKNSTKNIYCKNGKWIGTPPKCGYIKNILDKMNETCNFPERCEQLCYVENDIEKCTCHRGFRMKDNRCEDINECAENISVCEFGCINTVGSYQCKCPKGLRVGDVNSCIDVNECLLRNGHGPCQDTCINTWGGYKCSCDSLPGTKLSIDGHSCTDLDECTINNGGCSHTCINTMGRAFCLCPEGWTLDTDWKTCIDIDECAEDDNDDDNDSNNSRQKCEFGCINTPGSYSCLIDFEADQTIIEDDATECEDGFYWNRTNENCEDINECSENNGGCYHECVNNIGSYHCSCRPGYTFDIDRYTCIVSNSSLNISCPPLFPPKHGYLECSRPISFDITGSDLNNNNNNNNNKNNKNNNNNNNNNNYYDDNYNNMEGQHSITNRPGSQCILRCPTGFRINGKFSKHCSNYGEWIGENNGTCIRYPKPKLICPSDIVLEPSPNQTMAKLKIPRPKTDVNYEQDVSVYPNWFHNSEIALEVGTRNVTYTARHPVSKLLVSCTFKVTVLEGEPPVVKFCPTTQTYTLSKQHDSIKIAWKEPIFMDNVNVTEISRTNNPGNSFGVGSHQIVYTAKDQAGHETKCTFKILVNVPYRPILNHPLPIYHMFYKKK